MLRSRSRSKAFVAALGIVALIAGCANVSGPLLTAGPGVSPGASLPTLPADFASGGLPTIPPSLLASFGVVPTAAPTAAAPTAEPGGKTPKPSKTPKPGQTDQPTTPPDQPTTAPTEAPTSPPDNPHPTWPNGAIAASEAANHIGENLIVCGTVADANWLFNKTGHPTWLNFGNPYPNQNFNAVIWGEQRRAWPLAGKPEVVYPGHEICVTGPIEMYKTWPQIQDVDRVNVLVIQ